MNRKYDLYKYISEYDDQLINKINAGIDEEYLITEEFDKKIKDMCERKRMKKKNKNYLKIATAIIGMFLFVTGTGIVSNAATDGKLLEIVRGFLGASVITKENRVLIGEEVVDDSNIEIDESNVVEEKEKLSNEVIKDNEDILSQSMIIKSVEKNGVLPTFIYETEANGGIIPEVIMSNGALVVFYEDGHDGWNCNVGDTLNFDFDKYASNITENQSIIVGYVLDGVMYNGERFNELSGSYQMNIEKKGEYYIYVMSATSDYLTLKSGTISVDTKR